MTIRRSIPTSGIRGFAISLVGGREGRFFDFDLTDWSADFAGASEVTLTAFTM